MSMFEYGILFLTFNGMFWFGYWRGMSNCKNKGVSNK